MLKIFEYPSKNCTLCGLLELNGKSSVAALLSHIWGLEQSGVIGQLTPQYGKQKEKAKLTTP